MANKIGAKEAVASYHQAVRVWNNKTSEADARSILVENFGMNPASASDMIRNFVQLMKGEVYHRTLSELVTRIYFDNIVIDFGLEYLRNAINATVAHATYYEALSKDGGRPGLRKLCEEYNTLLVSHGADLQSNAAINFQSNVDSALQDSRKARLARLKVAPAAPARVLAQTIAYRRNPDVVAERLFQASGHCEHCRNPAPFERIDGRPFLEVHHRIPLAEGGDDVLNNTIALCPNCHREAHFGKKWEDFRN